MGLILDVKEILTGFTRGDKRGIISQTLLWALGELCNAAEQEERAGAIPTVQGEMLGTAG